MADPIATPVVASGASTSEAKGSKVVVVLSSVIAVLGTLTTLLDTFTTVIPVAQKGLGMWLALGGVAVAALTQMAYTVQRGFVKAAAIQAGVQVGTTPVDPAAAAANLGK